MANHSSVCRSEQRRLTHDMRTKLATATRWAAQRPRTNQQGIALQTVIVIVVMLVIAGGVSGVLLSRGSEVMADLEGVEVGVQAGDSYNACQTVGRSLSNNPSLNAGTGVATANTAGTWYNAAAGSGNVACAVQATAGTFSQQNCTNRGGTWAGSGTTGSAAACTWNAP